MKAFFLTVATIAIICAVNFPVIAEVSNFSVVANGILTGEQVKADAEEELRLLSKEVDPGKYSVLIQTFSPETAPQYLARKYYVVVSLVNKKTAGKPLVVRYEGPFLTEGGALALVRKGIKSINEDVAFNESLKQRL